ncbi:MAG: GldG family protein [Candidatus Aureabacteria bacterium]|nr:GldG family protein [Candidatus Auribacterota bacterium]
MKPIQTRSFIGLIAIVILFIVINAVSAPIFRIFRLDLTQEHIYSLSDGTKTLVKNLAEPVKLKYYFSATDSNDYPVLKNYGERVQDLLSGYARLSKQIELEIVDPRPDSEEAEWAEKYGLSGIQLPGGFVLYCGLVVANETGKEETIAFFDPKREEFLEYDISRLISSVSNPNKIKVGIYSPLPLEGVMKNPYMRQQTEGSDPWYFLNELKQLYDMEILRELSPIPPEINLLILIHPKQLSETDQYAVDQYILSGKSALILVDPFCEGDASEGQNPMMMGGARDSELPPTFTKAGIEMPKGKIILDRDLATQVQTQNGEVFNYYVWLNLTSAQTNKSDAITGKLESLHIPYSGFFMMKDQAKKDLVIEPLLSSSSTASIGDSSLLLFGGSPERITQSYSPGIEKLPIAVRVTGKLKTAFPAGKPKAGEKTENPGLKEEEKNKTQPEDTSPHLSESMKPVHVVLVADVDFISNRFSLNVANFMGNVLINPINDNLNFFFNSLESLSGSASLNAIRSRGKFARPFTRVKEIEKHAESRWLEEEKSLNQRVEEINTRIQAIMQQQDANKALTDTAIVDELQKFRNEKAETQKKLRTVRKNLRQEKEELGTQLFLINTFLVPFLILLYGLRVMILRGRHV